MPDKRIFLGGEASVGSVNSALAFKADKATSYTLTNSLTGNYSSGSVAICTLNDGNNKTISIANLTALGVHSWVVSNAHGSTTVVVTIPTAANNGRSNPTSTIPFGYSRIITAQLIGTITKWTVGRLYTVTT